jgi:hypothetical protein
MDKPSIGKLYPFQRVIFDPPESYTFFRIYFTIHNFIIIIGIFFRTELDEATILRIELIAVLYTTVYVEKMNRNNSCNIGSSFAGRF